MSVTRFLERRRPAWERLELLTNVAGRKGLRKLTDTELHELTRLYTTVAVDVARARTLGLDEDTQRRINRVAIAAHGLLYRRKREPAMPAVTRFLAAGYPRLFRRQWRFVCLALALLVVGTAGSYAAVLARPGAVRALVPGLVELPWTEEGFTAEDIVERFRALPAPPMAVGVMANNVSVAIAAFGLGITAGVGTCYVLFVNSMMLGGLAGHCANHGVANTFWSFVLPHGVLELMAIVIAGAAGLRLGFSVAVPGRLTRRGSLRRGAPEAAYLMLGTVPLFAVAGLIEGFVSPSTLPGGIKVLTGVAVGAAGCMYLTLGGRRGGGPVPARERSEGGASSRIGGES